MKMLLHIFISTAILTFHVGLGARFRCPSRVQAKPCLCQVKRRGLDITCENAQAGNFREAMQSVADAKQTIWYLKLRNNRLGKLDEEMLDDLDVRHLVAIHSGLSSIDESAFEDTAKELETLSLAKNDFERVPTRALEKLGALVTLNLDYNKLEILHTEAFRGLYSLLKLSLYGNRIKFIDNQAFVGIGTNLTQLNLGSNQLSSIPSRPMRNLPNLDRLQLHENKIEALFPEEFTKMGGDSLDFLDLANNKIKELPPRAFMSLQALNSLDLERNMISDINVNAFQGLEDSLEWLKLGNNSLEAIPAQAMRKLGRLRMLDLGNNNVSEIKEDDFMPYGKNLKFIYLQRNELVSIDTMSFMSLDSLEWLYLHSNNLASFPYETYTPVLNTLQVFDVHENPIHCDCKIAWLRDWVKNEGHNVLKEPSKTKCSTPEEYQDNAVGEISEDQLVCVSSAYMQHCSSVFLMSISIFAVMIFFS